MLAYIQTPLLAAFVLLELCGCAPAPHHTWLPLSEWGHSEPSLSSWDYLGLGNAYPSIHHRVDTPESWLPQPASPTIEIVRTYRKPAVDPAGWAQIPVIGGGRDSGRHWVALVPRGFEDFVLVRKPFVIVEETDEKTSKGDKSGSKNSKDDDDSKDEEDKDDKKPDRANETTKMTEATSSTSTTTVRSTSPSTTSTSTTPSTPPADDAENAAAMDGDSEPQPTKNRPSK